MEKIYIFGHKKPDTDTTVSAICLSYLKNKLGYNTKPYVLGAINNETKFVLDYFKVKEPDYLHDIKVQVCDVNYSKDLYIYSKSSIYDAYLYINQNGISTVPIIDKDKFLLGALSTKDITRNIFQNQKDELNTTIRNIATVLEGVYNGENSFVKGSVTLNNAIEKDHILIINREVEINNYTKLIVATGLSKNYLKKLKVPVITTDKDIVNITKLIFLSNLAVDAMSRNALTINENSELRDYISIAKKTKRTNYPVTNDDGQCLGVISSSDINDVKKKKVILVDHNEFEQSADGIEEADIVEVIDHHRIGLLGTTEPINFKNIPVGSTATIIYNMFKEYNIKMPKDIAGLLLSGIISDTLLYKSPTTTDIDIKAGNDLAKSCKIDIKDYAKKMFKARSEVKSNLEDMFFEDYKTFNIDNQKIGIAQITTTDSETVLEKKKELLDIIDNYDKNNELTILALFITDIINNGSYILYSNNSEALLKRAFGIENLEQGHFFKEVMSRKKQIVPLIMKTLEKK